MKAAVAELVGGEAAAEDAPEQLALLPLAEAGDLAEAGGDLAAARERRAGRPKGSRNKATIAKLAYLERRYRSPLEVLAETWSRPVETLADELRCSKRQAFELQQEAAKAALPYWHQRLTPDAQDVADGLVPLVIQVGAQASATVAADGMLGMQNQILSRRAAAVSDGEASDGAGEAVDPAAETGGEDANG